MNKDVMNKDSEITEGSQYQHVSIPSAFMSECNIQAELFRACAHIGLNCALEFQTMVGRLDVALFNHDWTRLIAIVECKHNRQGEVKYSMQIWRYKRIGVPVFGLAKQSNALRLASKIKQDYEHADGVLVSDLGKVERVNRGGKRRARKFNPENLDESLNYKEA